MVASLWRIGDLVDRLVYLCCPSLVEEGARGEELRAFSLVLNALNELCPWVEPIRLGVAVFPVRGPSRLLGGDEAVIAAAERAVMNCGLTAPVAIGIGPGLFAAGLAARHGVIVDAGVLASFLAPWPISVLARPKLAGVLPRLGIRTLGQFAELPHREVFGRFGADAAICLRVAQGLDGELAGLRDLSIARRLRSLTTSAAPLPKQATFTGGTGLADERLAVAARRLQAQLGADAVMVAHGRGGRSPCDQATLVPFGSLDALSSATAPWPAQLPSPAPTTVFTDARAVELNDVEDQPVRVEESGLLSAVPVTCRVDGGSLRLVENWAGPWPIIERWWLEPRRRVRLQLLVEPAAALLVVFERQSWWLEAVYD